MERRLLIGIVFTLEILLGVSPQADRLTWALENFPVWIGFGILFFTQGKFPLSRLCLWLLALHALILMLGGHYTYARVPLGEWAKEIFGFSRNHYDRVGHFAQGFIPAVLVREILLRKARLPNNAWLGFLTVCVCLAFSAFYELFEWWTALATGTAAQDFLGTQGDPWDTQWDMFLALSGATASVLLLKPLHDHSIGEVTAAPVGIDNKSGNR